MSQEPTRDVDADFPTDPSARSVNARLQELLGFCPQIQLRNLASESDLYLTPEKNDGKYVVEREIGRGGMGRVFLALDRDLGRRVAVKVISPELATNNEHLARFVEEAQITGQLEHPGIPPVHELALNEKGEIFFTLKLLKGRTLKDILQDLHIRRRETRERYSRIRLLMILQAVSNAVHFAHEKGVIHRDIKPENIMIGDYGEVQLMDWGLAKVLDAPEREPTEEPVETLRSGQNLETQQGRIHGTLQYMAPEQASGRSERIDRAADIYALGATLYEMLTLVPPRTGRTVEELIEECRLGLVIPPSERAPRQRIAAALEEICLTAMELHPEDRYPTALEMAEAIQNYIDGSREEERKRAESERSYEEAAKTLREHQRCSSQLEERLKQCAREQKTVGPRSSREQKKRLRDLRRAVEAQETRVAHKYTEAQTQLAAALAANPENTRARRALGELYVERFLRADLEGNASDLIFYRGLIEQVNDGHFDEVLRGCGSVSIEADPGGAGLTLERYEEQDDVVVAVAEVARARGRLDITALPMGSYRLLVEKEGYCPTFHPLRVRRSEKIRQRIRLYPEKVIPHDFVPVAAGAYSVASMTNPLPPRFWQEDLVRIDDFAMAIHPVTCQEYLGFLNDLARDDPDGARRRAPRHSPEAGYLWLPENGRFALPPADRYRWAARLPVFGVSFDDAQAYCRYRGARDGREYDLPTEEEWEKAARGADGREFTWGDHFDPEYCNSLYTREGQSGVVEVDGYGRDCSPYGVRGMVGNVGDWCYFFGEKDKDMEAVRGGNWALAGDPCRLSVRRSASRKYVSDRLGFRLVLRLR